MYERDILPTTVSLTIFAQYQNYWHSIDQTVATKVHATGVRCYNIAIYNKRIEPISFVFVSSSLRTAPYLAMVAGLWSLHCSCIVTGVAKINLRKKKTILLLRLRLNLGSAFSFSIKGPNKLKQMVLFMGSIFFCTRAISYIEYIKKNRDKTDFAQRILLLQRFVKKKKNC